ncbi:MAG: HAD-IA family hydrolase [Candidatus Dependentiae bacterium]|nr:HAD-IA family hydrolase [Candidatus Dependentiae bacterium]
MNAHKPQRGSQKRIETPKLVIFDCDGVLVDSEVLSYQTYAKVFAEENFRASPEELLRRLSGLTLADMISTIEKEEGIRFSSDIFDRIAKAIHEAFTNELKAMPGTAHLLERLAAAGIRSCVVSNGLKSRVDQALTVTGLKKYFPERHIFDISLVTRGKPAPDLLLYAAKSFSTSPAVCLVIDDSVTGIRAAQAAHMQTIAFLGGSHTTIDNYQEKVRATEPDAIAFSMDEVVRLIFSI